MEQTMIGEILSDSSFSQIIEAPIDIPAWLYSLPKEEYKRCSPDHIAAGATFADDGTRMSINVEKIGGSLLVQNYVEHVGEKDHVKLVSITDVFSPNGRTTSEVAGDLSVRKIDGNSCEYTNHARRVRPSRSSLSSKSTASRSSRPLPRGKRRRRCTTRARRHSLPRASNGRLLPVKAWRSGETPPLARRAPPRSIP
jgi:hypothetical protein